jgi:hypothetical protein
MSNPRRTKRLIPLTVEMVADTERLLMLVCVGKCRPSDVSRAVVAHTVHTVLLNGATYYETTCTRCGHRSYTSGKTAGIITPVDLSQEAVDIEVRDE